MRYAQVALCACDSFDCELQKTRNLQSLESHNQSQAYHTFRMQYQQPWYAKMLIWENSSAQAHTGY